MSVLYSPADPSRAYYGTETRMHQLLIGALLAVLLLRVSSIRQPRRWGSLAATCGLGALLVAFVTLGDSNSAYYLGLSGGVALATALLIWGLQMAPEGFAARVLGVSPARWIGKISYGAYLWHWPVILAMSVPVAAFAWMPEHVGLDASRVLVTFAIAGLSYRLVERPIREGTFPLIGGSLGRSAIALAAATLVVAVAVVSLTAVPSERAVEPGSSALDRIGCQLEVCLRYRSPEGDAPVIAVIGDSVARSLDPGVLALAERMGWTYVVAASDGCRVTHLLTAVDGETAKYEPCFETTPGLWRDLLQTWEPDLVLAVDSVELADLVEPSGSVEVAGDPVHVTAERRAMLRVADTFVGAGARFAIVAFPPVVTPPDCLRLEAQDLDACAIPASADRNVGTYNSMLSQLPPVYPGRAFLVSVTDHLCPNGICPPHPMACLPDTTAITSREPGRAGSSRCSSPSSSRRGRSQPPCASRGDPRALRGRPSPSRVRRDPM